MEPMEVHNVHSSVQNTTVVDMIDNNQSTLGEIKNECEIIWERIQETHHRLENRLEDKPAVGIEKFDASVKLLQHKERRLKAELKILKSKDIEVYSTMKQTPELILPVVSKDPKCLETLLLNDVTKTKEQLEATLVIIKGQRQELAGEITREKKILEEQEDIQRVLQKEIQVFQNQDNVHLPQYKVLEDLHKRKKQAKKYNSKSMKQLGTFVSAHFPKPDESGNKLDKENNCIRPYSYCTLLHLIEILMNHLFDSPHNPYIQQLPMYWPPYIELLLRYGIIQRHPNDCNLICLVGYHLK